jgi:hypothetical protein
MGCQGDCGKNTGLLIGIAVTVLLHLAHESAAVAGEPVTIAGVREKPVAIHGEKITDRVTIGERRISPTCLELRKQHGTSG